MNGLRKDVYAQYIQQYPGIAEQVQLAVAEDGNGRGVTLPEHAEVSKIRVFAAGVW